MIQQNDERKNAEFKPFSGILSIRVCALFVTFSSSQKSFFCPGIIALGCSISRPSMR